MRDFMKIGGCALVLIAAVLISRAYSSFVSKRISQYAGFIALVLHIEGMIDRFLSSGRELWENFSNDALAETGLLSFLSEGKPIYEAYLSAEPRLLLSDSLKERLKGYFKNFGTRYKDGEVREAQALRRELESGFQQEKEELERKMKVARALIFGTALTALILFL